MLPEIRQRMLERDGFEVTTTATSVARGGSAWRSRRWPWRRAGCGRSGRWSRG